MKREEAMRIIAKFDRPLRADVEIFTASKDEWQLREAAERWQARNCQVVYGCESPQPPFVRAMLAFGNLKLMQREWLFGE